MSKQPLKVLVTGAAGQIAYSLLYMVSRGVTFGEDQPIILHLLDIEPMMPVLNGVVMELQDCAFPLLKSVVATFDEKTAFNDIDIALLVGAMPRKEGMERKDLLRANVKIFSSQGQALEKFAKKTVKVLVVGNPANTNCCIASRCAPSIPKKNFSALTRLDMNRAKGQVALKLGVPVENVRGCIIWGNHSNTQFADVAHGTVKLLDGKEVNIPEALKDDQWIETEFLKCVQTRGAAVIKARKLSSAMSAAKAISDHMYDWCHGSNDWVSMGVMSDGSYGAPKDIIFSYPVTIEKATGEWKIVQGLNMSDWAKEKFELTAKELLEEREMALAEIKN